ncbi:exported hypothetical protein [Agrobacterium salinitolerans str. Hayward 0363]|nr:exported hypothetical protein [Agrobacterium salinitolerans str. Hayward 0363]
MLINKCILSLSGYLFPASVVSQGRTCSVLERVKRHENIILLHTAMVCLEDFSNLTLHSLKPRIL